MDGLRASTAAHLAPSLRAAWRRSVFSIRRSSTARYLRGLTPARVGLVLLICTLFSVRQQMISNAPFDGDRFAAIAIFLAWRFLCALPMLLAVTVADNLTVRSRQWVRILALSAAVVLGALVYGMTVLHTHALSVRQAAAGKEILFILTYSSQALLYGGLATVVLYLFVREREDARALHTVRLAKVSLDRQTIEAQLQALQAQIEPHFLFNTLATIKLLYETESSRAKPLIHDLAAYLHTALPKMRDPRSTLASELELTQAYLRVLKVRMGERLKVVIVVPPDLLEASIPPMMLLTLVENAIKHGLGSLSQGGTITIRAELLTRLLRVSVIDDGVGFPKGFGAGVGLANTRARLAALYSNKARLTLDANPRGGVIATIELPYEISATG